MARLTPAQQQYYDLKKKYKDCILFFRMGDFYETFDEDAQICSKTLDIALTSRDKNSENSSPMAGVPYHSSDKYITRLVKEGYKIALAEQIGDVVPGQLVQRQVTEVVTPGTYIEEKDNTEYNFIGSIYFETNQQGSYHIAWGDFSLGEYFTKSFQNLEDLLKFIQKLSFSEIVIDIDFPEKEQLQNYIKNVMESLINIYDAPYNIDDFLKEVLNVQTISSYGKALEDGREKAIGLLFNYLKDTQNTLLKNVSKISYYGDENKVMLDDITIRNLEVFRSSYEGSKKHSLIGVIDKTQTSMGGRLINSILLSPIRKQDDLKWRLDGIQYFYDHLSLAEDIIGVLKGVSDIPRTLTTIIYRRNTPHILNKLKFSLRSIFSNDFFIQELKNFGSSQETIKKVKDIYDELEEGIKDEDYKEDMDFIKDGYSQEVDELRKVAYHSDDLLISYQQELVQQTGIQNIKIKYIKNQGYFIEVSKTNQNIFEKHFQENSEKFNFMRRQTLKQVERYATTYLEEVERKIITSHEKLQKKERELLNNFKDKLQEFYDSFWEFSGTIGWIDLFSGFGKFSHEKGRTKPSLQKQYPTSIKKGRHPVIEEFLPVDENFIPNDVFLDKEKFLHIITGPNMGGKSTFLRQNAIIVLLAHCGLWVPADKAEISLVDGLFARVGSGDILAKNQSTFMTEMIEVSNILHNATKDSFIILDELGRGTSTYDGMALAKSIAEYIARKVGSKTLFATHYHELINLDDIPGVENFSVAVYETEKEVVFLKKIVEGGASKSYGIDVAELAGLPKEVLEDSKKYLTQYESSNSSSNKPISQPLFSQETQKDERVDKYEKLKKDIQAIDINNITPIKAMEVLNNLKNNL